MAEETQKNVVIKVSTDTSQAQNNLDELTKKLDEAGKIDVDKPFKRLKEELKQAQVIAEQANIKFGETSEEFRIAAGRVAELKAQFGDFQGTINAFNPENKLQAIVSIASGAVTAIQGVAGALTLVGVNSETANEAVARLQGLLALGNALEGIDNIVDGYGNLVKVIKGSTIAKGIDNAATKAATALQRLFKIEVIGTGAAFNTLKGAIIATGIGALVVGIGILVSKLIELKDANEDAANSQKDLNDALLSAQENFVRKTLDIETNLAIAKARARGASDQEILNIQLEGLDKQIALNNQKSFDLEVQQGKAFAKGLQNTKEYNDRRVELTNIEIENDELFAEKKRLGYEKEARDRDKANQKAEEQNRKAQQKRDENAREAQQKAATAAAELVKIQNEITRRGFSTEKDKELFDLKVQFDQRKKILEDGGKSTAELVELYELQRTEIIKKYKDKQEEAERDYQRKIKGLVNQINIGNLKDERERQREEIRVKYTEQLETELEQIGNNFFQRLQVILLYKQLQRQEELKLENGFKQQDLEEQLQLLDEEIQNEDTKLERKKELLQKERDLILAAYNQGVIDKKEYEKKLAAINKQSAEADKKITQTKIDTANQYLKITADVFGALADISKENSAEQKALAIAQALINTFLSISNTLQLGTKTTPGPVAIAQAIATGLFGFLQVKKILETKVPGEEGGDPNAAKVGTEAGGGGVAGAAPIIEAVATAPEEIQNVRVTNQCEPIRAYITNSDLQTNESRNRFLNGLSTI